MSRQCKRITIILNEQLICREESLDEDYMSNQLAKEENKRQKVDAWSSVENRQKSNDALISHFKTKGVNSLKSMENHRNKSYIFRGMSFSILGFSSEVSNIFSLFIPSHSIIDYSSLFCIG